MADSSLAVLPNGVYQLKSVYIGEPASDNSLWATVFADEIDTRERVRALPQKAPFIERQAWKVQRDQESNMYTLTSIDYDGLPSEYGFSYQDYNPDSLILVDVPSAFRLEPVDDANKVFVIRPREVSDAIVGLAHEEFEEGNLEWQPEGEVQSRPAWEFIHVPLD